MSDISSAGGWTGIAVVWDMGVGGGSWSRRTFCFFFLHCLISSVTICLGVLIPPVRVILCDRSLSAISLQSSSSSSVRQRSIMRLISSITCFGVRVSTYSLAGGSIAGYFHFEVELVAAWQKRFCLASSNSYCGPM